jgi:hypothetical protein
MNMSLPIISAVVGVIVLLFGRKLFWLCVAAIGFAAGVELAPQFVHEPSALLALTFAVVLGFVGALLALFLQKLAIALAGFLAGGKFAVALMAAFFVHLSQTYWLTFLIGGVIGAVLLLMLFDWALIVISSLLGAYLISGVVSLPAAGSVLLFAGLVVCGVLVQAASLRRTRVAPID